MLKKFLRAVITLFSAAIISFAIGALIDINTEIGHVSGNYAASIGFIWQIVLLGFVAGAAIFTVPLKNTMLTKKQSELLFSAGACTVASTALVLIGFCGAYLGVLNQIYIIQQLGGILSTLGIFLVSWGISMAAVELTVVAFQGIKSFYRFE